MANKAKLYLVQRIAWCPVHNEAFQRGMCEQHESVEGMPVRAFTTKEKASDHAHELMAEARRELNPFQFARVEAITNQSGTDLLLAIARLGHAVWVSEYFDWVRWYDEIADSLTVPERDAIWDLLDRLELYRVVEVEFF